MDRRSFLKTTGAVAATTGALGTAGAAGAATRNDAPVTASKPIVVRVAVPWPASTAGPCDQIHRLARDIRSASDDRIILSIVPKRTVYAGLKTIAFRGGAWFGPLLDFPRAHKTAVYFSGLPHAGGLSALDLDGWLTLAGGQPLWDEFGAELGVKPILAGHMGEMPGLWSKTPINSLEDLSGRKVVVTGPYEDIMHAIGATPIRVNTAELTDILAGGRIDVVECGGFQTAMSLGLHKSARHVTTGILGCAGTALALAISKDVWESLSVGDQTIITACASQSYRLTLMENRALETPLSTALTNHYGVEVHKVSSKANKAWERISDTILAHLSGSDERAQHINASYSAFRALCG